MGFILANCAHCHHGLQTKNDNASYSLLQTICWPTPSTSRTESSARAWAYVLIPGRPEESAIYLAAVEAMKSDYTGDLKLTPPVGLHRVSDEVALILSDWIWGGFN